MGRREIIPHFELSEGQLTSAMAGIGMHFNAKPNYDVNIEDTVYYASIAGMEKNDLRTLSVLTMWLDTYYRWLNADRLTKIVSMSGSQRVCAFWVGFAQWKFRDNRFKRLAKIYRGQRLDLLASGTEFHLSRYGEDDRFENAPIRVPANVLRRRPMDVVPATEMMKNNRFIRYRILVGPTYRADMWAILDLHPQVSAYRLAKMAYGSYATAWQVKKDWEILNAGQSPINAKSIA